MSVTHLYVKNGNPLVGKANWNADHVVKALEVLSASEAKNVTIAHDETDAKITPSAGDIVADCPANKTIRLTQVVWDDLRVTPGSFDRPGVADPSIVTYRPGGGSNPDTYLWEFDKNDIASFTVQLPHGYKAGEDIKVHVHWTPGGRGVTESGNTVGWKVQYAWANIAGAFGAMATADLSDAANGVNGEHNMTPEATITGSGKGISSMLICNILRTDTGTDDTWTGSGSGNLPMLLEIDFHYPIDTIGSRQVGTK
jgi:hypothetical protein